MTVTITATNFKATFEFTGPEDAGKPDEAIDIYGIEGRLFARFDALRFMRQAYRQAALGNRSTDACMGGTV